MGEKQLLDFSAITTIYCIGRNFNDHIQEMGAEKPKEPIVFLKPVSSLVPNNSVIPYPDYTTDLQYEGEIVVMIGEDAYKVQEKEAENVIAGYAVGIDFTLRDVQHIAKRKGLPWAIAKGFFPSAAISTFVPREEVEFPLELSLFVNNQLRQYGSTERMIWSIPEIVAYLSRYFYIRSGDIIFTGTPSGVGSVYPGDKLRIALHYGQVVYTALEVEIAQ